jgi:hypothetical protein
MFVKIAAWCGVWALIEHWDCGLRKKNFYDTECRPEHVEKWQAKSAAHYLLLIYLFTYFKAKDNHLAKVRDQAFYRKN